MSALGLAKRTMCGLYRRYKLAKYRRSHGNGDDVVVTLWSGLRMRLRYRDHIAQRVLLERRFEPELASIALAVIREGMVVVDVGANIGVHTLLFAQLVGPPGRVVAIEPNPTALASLHENTALNGLTNIDVLDMAASDVEGVSDFVLPVTGLEAFGGFRNTARVAVDGRVRVATRRLDDAICDLGLTRVDFLKVDVEGAELQVLEGTGALLLQQPQPTIVYEASRLNLQAFSCSEDDLRRCLEELGYVVHKISSQERLAVPQ